MFALLFGSFTVKEISSTDLIQALKRQGWKPRESRPTEERVRQYLAGF